MQRECNYSIHVLFMILMIFNVEHSDALNVSVTGKGGLNRLRGCALLCSEWTHKAGEDAAFSGQWKTLGPN